MQAGQPFLDDAQLMKLVSELLSAREELKGQGAKTIAAELHAAGHSASYKRVARILRALAAPGEAVDAVPGKAGANSVYKHKSKKPK